MRTLLWVVIIASTIIAGAMALADTAVTHAAVQDVARGGTMRIRIELDGTTMTGTLTDTSKDFASLLPLTLTMKDYAAAEKISDLPKNSPREVRPQVSTILLETSRTTRPRGTSPSSTRMPIMRAGLSGWAR